MPGAGRPPRLPLVGIAFFLSGAAALAYQVAWQRILALQTGVGLYSIAIIVAAFMVGLGVGSHLGGVLSSRVSARGALAVFAACELGIAGFGASSCRLYYDWLYVRLGWLYADPTRGALLHFVTLAVPTVLMGLSLPFLARAMVRDLETASGTIAFLYAINVLGAAAGALATPWIFIRHFGIPTAVRAAAAANLVAGLSALALAARRSRGDVPAAGVARRAETAGAPTPCAEAPASFRLWLALYALSGFSALSLEMLWFRIVEIGVKATAYTFGTLLAVYLLGSALGSLAGIPLARRVTRPRRAFLAAQCLLLAYAAAMVALVVRLPPDLPGYVWYYELWGGYRSYNLGGALHLGALLRLYVVLPLVLFGPPTFLMGLSYPILQRAVQDDVATAGRKVGLLQAANIAGCAAGSLLVGVVALTWLGSAGTFRVLALGGLVFAVLGWREGTGRRWFAFLAAVLAFLAVALPSNRGLWMRLHGTGDPATLVGEDATGVVALIPAGERWSVWGGGRTHSSLPFGGIHTVLGAAPAVIHPAPVEVAIIGLGSGDTAASAGCRRDVPQRITVFEIYAPEHRLLSALLERPQPPARLGRLLGDPRFSFRIADGRKALDAAPARYDLIEADALWPTSPYAGNLYSLEFFARSARALKPGGLVTTWAPTERVRATFLAALPHVLELADGQVLVGSNEPIAIDPAAWRLRLYAPSTIAYLGPPRVSSVWEELRKALPARPAAAGVETNHDLVPRDEFNMPD